MFPLDDLWSLFTIFLTAQLPLLMFVLNYISNRSLILYMSFDLLNFTWKFYWLSDTATIKKAVSVDNRNSLKCLNTLLIPIIQTLYITEICCCQCKCYRSSLTAQLPLLMIQSYTCDRDCSENYLLDCRSIHQKAIYTSLIASCIHSTPCF